MLLQIVYSTFRVTTQPSISAKAVTNSSFITSSEKDSGSKYSGAICSNLNNGQHIYHDAQRWLRAHIVGDTSVTVLTTKSLLRISSPYMIHFGAAFFSTQAGWSLNGCFCTIDFLESHVVAAFAPDGYVHIITSGQGLLNVRKDRRFLLFCDVLDLISLV
ncbi:hypothetical protein JOM56_014661 [Amanita muscaria]